MRTYDAESSPYSVRVAGEGDESMSGEKKWTGRDTEEDRRKDKRGDPPVYESEVPWGNERVNTEDWDIGEETAARVYDNLIEKVSNAVRTADPQVVVVGEPQYRALWVYVDTMHDEAENPEQLVPLTMVVVPGPQLHVERRNLDVLFDNY